MARSTTSQTPRSHGQTEGRVTPSLNVSHPDYYFEDGNSVILVEHTLFRVFRSTFTRHSPVFRDLFSLPGPVGQPAEGVDDDHPLHFSGISAVEFERLLWVLYPQEYGVHQARTADEWTSILSLATRWDFAAVRALAIRQLQTLELGPVDRIVLAREYDIAGGRWLLGAYAALCERTEPLALDEAARLGLETATRVAQLREQLRSGGRKSSSRIGGYHALTRSAAVRHATTAAAAAAAVNVSVKPPRAERLQWGIGRSFLDQRDIPPPVRVSSSPQRAGGKKGAAAIPGTARLIAEAFGINLAAQTT